MKLQSIRPCVELVYSHHKIRRSWGIGVTVLMVLMFVVSSLNALTEVSGARTIVGTISQNITPAATVVAQTSSFQQTQTAEVQFSTTTPESATTPMPVTPSPALRDPTMLQDISLISGEPCAAPCFRGIIPGETSWRDALTIIYDDLEFRNLQIQGPEEDNPAIQAAWQQGDDAPVCCQMVTQDGETVSLIFVRTAPEHSLGDLIDVHGEPTYLTGQEFTEDQAIMSLVYPEVPMVVYIFVAGAETGDLRASSEIIGMLYFEEEDMDLLLQTTDLHAWEGYQSSKDYAEGELEVTPSITLTPTPDN